MRDTSNNMATLVIILVLIMGSCMFERVALSQDKVPPKRETVIVLVGLIAEHCRWDQVNNTTLRDQMVCVQRGIEDWLAGRMTDEGMPDYEK